MQTLSPNPLAIRNTVESLFNLANIPCNVSLLDIGLNQNDTTKVMGELKRVFGKEVNVKLTDTFFDLHDKLNAV